MKIQYSQDVDALYITFKDTEIIESDEILKDIIADYDQDGNLVGLEILWASGKMDIDQLIIQAFDKITIENSKVASSASL